MCSMAAHGVTYRDRIDEGGDWSTDVKLCVSRLLWEVTADTARRVSAPFRELVDSSAFR
jgi:hypothetical protein